MTTIRQIVNDAYREGGLVQIGLTPDADEFDEGLRRLLALIKSVVGNELGSPLETVSYGDSGFVNAYAKAQDVESFIDNTFVPANTRLAANISSAKTVYLDPNPNDGARLAILDSAGNFATYNLTVHANGRSIEGATSVILNTNGTAKEWFYRADLGEWVLLDTLTANSQLPFPTEFDDLFITLLAMRVSSRYQQEVSPATMQTLARSRNQFRARYKQITEAPSEIALTRLSLMNYWLGSDNTASRFMHGNIL